MKIDENKLSEDLTGPGGKIAGTGPSGKIAGTGLGDL
jgi:hypothetical protein